MRDSHGVGGESVSKGSSPDWRGRGSGPRGHPSPSRAPPSTTEEQPGCLPAGGVITTSSARASPDAAKTPGGHAEESAPASPASGHGAGPLGVGCWGREAWHPTGAQPSRFSAGIQAFDFLCCSPGQNGKAEMFTTHQSLQQDCVWPCDGKGVLCTEPQAENPVRGEELMGTGVPAHQSQ